VPPFLRPADGSSIATVGLDGSGEMDYRMPLKFQMLKKSVLWIFIPVLLVASLFACCTSRYEPLVDSVICLGAMVFIQRAVWRKQYFWAGGFLAIMVAFCPFSLVFKIFLLMIFTCIATLKNLLETFRAEPVPVI
jgi:hypothetical protein